MKRKSVIALVLAAGLSLSLFGCGSKTADPTGAPASPPPPPPPAPPPPPPPPIRSRTGSPPSRTPRSASYPPPPAARGTPSAALWPSCSKTRSPAR